MQGPRCLRTVSITDQIYPLSQVAGNLWAKNETECDAWLLVNQSGCNQRTFCLLHAKGSNSAPLGSLWYTHIVLCICNQQTSDPGWLKYHMVWSLYCTDKDMGPPRGNLPELTERLIGEGRTQATENGSTVRTLGVTLVFPGGQPELSENGISATYF